MPRKRRDHFGRRTALSADARTIFETGEVPARYRFFRTLQPPLPRWEDVCGEIIGEWIITSPGTRPFAWWTNDAPEPRRQVAGSGTPSTDVVRGTGVPETWADVSSGDPPHVESEAAFLRRLRLLRPGEKARLTAEDFAPERVRLAFRRWPSSPDGAVRPYWFTIGVGADVEDDDGSRDYYTALANAADVAAGVAS